MKRPAERPNRYFSFLRRLRADGRSNMYGAIPYLAAAFGLDRGEAFRIVCEWVDAHEPDAVGAQPGATGPASQPIDPTMASTTPAGDDRSISNAATRKPGARKPVKQKSGRKSAGAKSRRASSRRAA